MIDIAVRDLVKEYEVGQPVLNGLTFQVDTGERVGILGRNGAVKRHSSLSPQLLVVPFRKSTSRQLEKVLKKQLRLVSLLDSRL